MIINQKRGQGLSTNAIVLIILAVVVLVILIAGFTVGWTKLLPFLGGGDNVNSLAQTCSAACAQGSVFDYCDVERELNLKQSLGDLNDGDMLTCNQLSGSEGLSPSVRQQFACASITCLTEEAEETSP